MINMCKLRQFRGKYNNGSRTTHNREGTICIILLRFYVLNCFNHITLCQHTHTHTYKIASLLLLFFFQFAMLFLLFV